MRPLHLGELGVLNLEVLSWALCMRWLWQRKTQPNKPWTTFNMAFLDKIKIIFHISVSTTVGDSHTTLFWLDIWLFGRSIPDIALALMPFVRRRGWRTQHGL